MPHPAVGFELAPVANDDARALLSSVLKSMEAQVAQLGSLVMIEYSEDSTHRQARCAATSSALFLPSENS
jgi:hypothetical protein